MSLGHIEKSKIHWIKKLRNTLVCQSGFCVKKTKSSVTSMFSFKMMLENFNKIITSYEMVYRVNCDNAL